MKPGAFGKRRSSLRLHRETLRVLLPSDLAHVVGGVGAVVTDRPSFNAAPKTNGWSANVDAHCGI
ncbi:MAG TPA: hypothetical protein VIG06_09635 [Kofleriaceae bacterium]|jgi:hypothetical protein